MSCAERSDRAHRSEASGIGCLRYGVLLVFGAPSQLRLLMGQEHGRTIPLADLRSVAPFEPAHSRHSLLLVVVAAWGAEN